MRKNKNTQAQNDPITVEKNRSFLRKMADRWPSGAVAREEVDRFTGGAITPKSMANLDSQGLGCESFLIGRKRVYDVDVFIDWLAERMGEKSKKAAEATCGKCQSQGQSNR